MFLACTDKNTYHQVFHRHYRSYDRPKQDDSNKSRLTHELLYHTLILGRTNSHSLHDFPQHCRADKEVDGYCGQFHCLGYG